MRPTSESLGEDQCRDEIRDEYHSDDETGDVVDVHVGASSSVDGPVNRSQPRTNATQSPKNASVRAMKMTSAIRRTPLLPLRGGTGSSGSRGSRRATFASAASGGTNQAPDGAAVRPVH